MSEPTEREIIEAIAVRLMGWEKEELHMGEGLLFKYGPYPDPLYVWVDKGAISGWNPLIHWRDAGMVADELAKKVGLLEINIFANPKAVSAVEVFIDGQAEHVMRNSPEPEGLNSTGPRAISMAAYAWCGAQETHAR